MNSSLQLKIPARLNSATRNFDTKQKSVDEWISALPLGNPSETAKLVYSALIEINRSEIATATRLSVLESLRHTIHYTESCLKKHYIGQALPLSFKNQKHAELAQELINELCIGYKIIVIENNAQKRPNNKLLAQAAHRAIRYLGKELIHCYQIYSPPPPGGLWREIHSLYSFAEANDLASIQIKDDEETQVKSSTIDNLYKQILLLSLACPYRLRQGEVDAIQEELENWAEFSTLARIKERNSSTGGVIVNIDSDDAPNHIMDESLYDQQQFRLLDTATLAVKIRAQLRNAQEKTTGPGTLQTGSLTQDLLRRLVIVWGVMSKRRFSRMPKTSGVKVGIGLNAVHHHLASTAKTTQNQDAQQDEGEPNFLEKADFNSSKSKNDLPELWEISDIPENWGRATSSKKESESTPPEEHAKDWDMVNASAGGFCLLWAHNTSCAAQVGELLSIKDEEQSTWSLAVIRWMKCTKDRGLEIGIQMLAPNAVNVATKVDRARNHDFFRSILLPPITAIKQPSTIITPIETFQVGDTLQAKGNIDEHKIKLSKLVENTGSFAIYTYIPIKFGSHTVEAKKESEDKFFNSIWSSI